MIAFLPVRPACAVLLIPALTFGGCIEQTVRIDPAVDPHAAVAHAPAPTATASRTATTAAPATSGGTSLAPVAAATRPAIRPHASFVMINTRPHDAHTVFTLTRHLPVAVQVDAVRLGPAGLERCELDVRNPLVWWQRFPCDIAADLLPIRYISLTTATIAFAPVPTCDEAALTSEATIHGFAHDPAR